MHSSNNILLLLDHTNDQDLPSTPLLHSFCNPSPMKPARPAKHAYRLPPQKTTRYATHCLDLSNRHLDSQLFFDKAQMEQIQQLSL